MVIDHHKNSTILTALVDFGALIVEYIDGSPNR